MSGSDLLNFGLSGLIILSGTEENDCILYEVDLIVSTWSSLINKMYLIFKCHAKLNLDIIW